SGLPVFCIVGLPAMVVKESKERVRAALLNSRFEFPAGRITVSLAPAHLPKEGGRFDLPIALGILLASGQIRTPPEARGTCVAREFYGELGLTGELKPVRGLLLAAAHAARHGHELVVPRANAAEACAVAPAQVRAAGYTPECLGQRPFRAPHHTASAAALVGGGARARPGEISLAHHGVLFLDELPEFDRGVLEALREPLETGVVAVSRAALQTHYPAAFQLIGAMNPCPCGRLGDPSGGCRCTPAQVQRYRGRISAPLLDRLNMHVEVPRMAASEFDAVGGGETTPAAAARIAGARTLQLERQQRCNARLTDAGVQRWCGV